MTKVLKPYPDDDTTISFDSRALIKSCFDAMDDLANGRLTLAEARALQREQRDALNRLKAIRKCEQMAKRASKLNWK